MAGSTNTGIVIDISGRLTNGEEIFKGLQSQLNKLDLSSKVGKDFQKMLSEAEAARSKAEKNSQKRVTSELSVQKVNDQVDVFYDKLRQAARLLQTTGTNDLNLKNLGAEFEQIITSIQNAEKELQNFKSNTDFSSLLRDSEAIKQVFSSLGKDLSQAGTKEIGKTLNDNLKQTKEDLKAAQGEVKKYTQQLEELRRAESRIDKSIKKIQTGEGQKRVINTLNRAQENNFHGIGFTDTNSILNGLNQAYTSLIDQIPQGQLTGQVEDTIQRIFSEFDVNKIQDLETLSNTLTNIKVQLDALQSSTGIDFGKILGQNTDFQALQAMAAHTPTKAETSMYEQVKTAATARVQYLKDELTNNVDQTANRDVLIQQLDQILSEIGTSEVQSFLQKIEEAERQTIQQLQVAKVDIQGRQGAVQGDLNEARDKAQQASVNVAQAQAGKDSFASIRAEYDAKIQQLTQTIENLRNQLTALKQGRLSTLHGAGKGFEDDANNNIKQGLEYTEKYNAALEKVQERTRTLGKIEGFVQRWFSIYAVTRMVSKIFRDIVNTVKELDKTMTEISIVTDMSQGDLWKQVPQYTEMARQYGASISGVYKVSQLYYQQGLQTVDVMKLTSETLKMARISGLDYAEATNYMTNALRSFKMDMQDAGHIVDVYSVLAASAATNVEELAKAMSKTASSAEAVGSSFENTSAMMAVMIEATREAPENIGSAMKSIISRYGELKEDPTKLVDSEGEELSLNKVDTALKSVGISLHDAAGQFRDFDDVIMELAASWNTIDKNTQRYIATVMA